MQLHRRLTVDQPDMWRGGPRPVLAVAQRLEPRMETQEHRRPHYRVRAEAEAHRQSLAMLGMEVTAELMGVAAGAEGPRYLGQGAVAPAGTEATES